MSYHSIRSQLLSQKKLYEDPLFPPNQSSVYYNGVVTAGRPANVRWKRPGDLVKNPKFIVGKASRFDLYQGQLGNCWFVAAAATLATSHQKQFSLVCPPDQRFDQEYAGIFRFNFWRYGKWTEVVVDDFLPCDESGLLYCRNREEPNEFWSALLEKAYAKFHGCYQALDGGKQDNALVDFTGGISEVISLEDKTKVPADLYDLMWKTSRMNSMLGAGIYSAKPVSPNGLMEGHAYSITGFASITRGVATIKLIRLRNPWGRNEWNGAWSDRSPEMRSLSAEQKKRLNIVIVDDGEFWMNQHDFIENFAEVSICHLQPDSFTEEVAVDLERKQWAVAVYHGSWIRGVTARGLWKTPTPKYISSAFCDHSVLNLNEWNWCLIVELYWSNPQFHVTLAEQDDDSRTGECTLVVSLLEKEYTRDNKVAIGFDVYRLRSGYPEALDGENVDRRALRLAARSGNFLFDREVTKRFRLPFGIYIIIPSTFQPNKEAEFLLRLFAEKRVVSGIINVPSNPLR